MSIGVLGQNLNVMRSAAVERGTNPIDIGVHPAVRMPGTSLSTSCVMISPASAHLFAPGSRWTALLPKSNWIIWVGANILVYADAQRCEWEASVRASLLR
jgi:hypothetical protein